MRGALLGSLVATVLAVQPAAAQRQAVAPVRGWTFGASGMAMVWTDDTAPFDVLGGPGFQLGYIRPRGVGMDFRGAYLVPTGFYGLTGVSGILGLSYSLPAGTHIVQLKAGAAAFGGGDSDGSIFAGGGPYGGVGAVLRIAGRLGLQSDVLARYYETGDRGVFAPSASVGLVLLRR